MVTTWALATAFSSRATAQQANPPIAAVLAASAPGKGGVVGAAKVTATVVALDAPTRAATLNGETDNIVDLVAPPEAKNIDQIRVGDRGTVEYMRALTLELRGQGQYPLEFFAGRVGSGAGWCCWPTSPRYARGLAGQREMPSRTHV